MILDLVSKQIIRLCPHHNSMAGQGDTIKTVSVNYFVGLCFTFSALSETDTFYFLERFYDLYTIRCWLCR